MSDTPLLSPKENQNNPQTNKGIPFYMRLYPPLAEKGNEPQSDFHNMFQLNTSKNNMKSILGKDDNEEENELTQEFLDDLVKPNSLLPKARIIEVVSKAIMNSKLIEKIEDDNKVPKKVIKKII